MARLCVAGGGLAGALLTWRLRQVDPTCQVELLLGEPGQVDATAASGGAVRAFEPDPQQRRLAVDSLLQLLDDPVLRQWSDFQLVSSVYLLAGDDPAGLANAGRAVAELDRALPGSAELVDGSALAAAGFGGLPPDAWAVREARAGYLSPHRLREAVLADLAGRAGVELRPGSLDKVALGASGTVDYRAAGRWRSCDQLVVAAGPWTGDLLRRLGLPGDGYRTKAIQYTIHRVDGWRPPIFIDEPLGLYGRPAGEDSLLLGRPTDRWGADPERPPIDPGSSRTAAGLVRQRFPGLRLGPVVRTVSAVDCYAAQPGLELRPIAIGLYSFTGGAGGAVKTVLAASQQAAAELTGAGERSGPTPVDTLERGP